MLIPPPLPLRAPAVSTMRRAAACLASLSLAASSALGAAPQNLNTLKFTEVVDKVVIIDAVTQRSRPASVNQTFKVPDQISTGANSRAELVAPDGTVTRVGANTVFSFAADKRQVNLQKGSILFHSPEGKGGGVIASDGAQAAVMGTTLIVTATANKGFKLLVLEGKAKATLPSGNSIAVTAGQLTVVAPGKSDFGPVLNFRLKEQVAGSALMKGFRTPIASERKVLDSVERQERMIASGRAESTNMRVRGDQLMEENGPPPVNKNELPRPTEAAKGIISLPSDSDVNLALSLGVYVGQRGKEPGTSLLGSGRTPLSLVGLLSRLTLSSGLSVPSTLSSVFGETSFIKLKSDYGDKTTRILLAKTLTLEGQDPLPPPVLLPGEEAPQPLEHFPQGGNVAEFVFPDLLIDVKIIATSGAISINDNRTQSELLEIRGVPSPSQLTNLTTELALAQGPIATEKLLWILGKPIFVTTTFLVAKAESFVLGIADATVSSAVTLTDSILFNRSGSVDVRGSSITGNNLSAYARGDVSFKSLGDISITNTWARTLSAAPVGSSLSMVAGGVIDIAGGQTLNTNLNATSISLDARTINLTNVDFSAGSVVTLKSSNGQLAPNPNTGQASVPLRVNFINGVKYGGVLIPSTTTTANLQTNGLPVGTTRNITIIANGR